MRESLIDELTFYAKKGYQIVFDYSGIRVWYLPTFGNMKLYEGEFMHEALVAIDTHYRTLEGE